MPYFKTSNEWYEQSSLLLKARPSTYTVLKPTSSKITKRQKYASKRAQTTLGTSTSTTSESQPQHTQEAVEAHTATFVLKTYDPVSGVCLKYETNKAAEVGRLIATLGRLGKHHAGIKEVMNDLADPASRGGIDTPEVAAEGEKDKEGDVKMTDVGKILESKTGAAGGGRALNDLDSSLHPGLERCILYGVVVDTG